MCRLVWAFAGHTYHIVGNLMLRLICLYPDHYIVCGEQWRLAKLVLAQACLSLCYLHISTKISWTGSFITGTYGSVVECLTRDREAAGSSLTGSLRCGPWARHIYPSLVLTVSNRNAGRTVETPELRSYNAEFRSFSMDSPPFLVFDWR